MKAQTTLVNASPDAGLRVPGKRRPAALRPFVTRLVALIAPHGGRCWQPARSATRGTAESSD
jgi:hypothetical protein